MAINVFIPKFHTDEILEEIRECLDKGWTGLGFKTVKFEEAWKTYTGLPHAHFLNSNTAGLHLAVHILKNKFGWIEGDEIISTPITFVSTNHAIVYERLKPVFADVDEYLCLDPEDIAKKITSRTRAVMYVGMGGNTGQLDAVTDICKRHNLTLIIDAAHMAGTKYHGKHVGSEADVAIFSFQAVKNLPTADSGMICFKDKDLDKWARQLTWLGISKDTYARFNKNEGSYKWRYDVPDVGFKYHGNSIMASIGLVQLKYLEEDNLRRNELASLYDELLKDNQSIRTIPIAPGSYSARHLYQILVPNRDEVIQHFYNNEIYPGVHYWNNINYPMYAYAKGTCPRAEEISQSVISLPLHLNLDKEDIEKVVIALNEAILANGKIITSIE
jgi:dTDP-4-amino-4,6-dideoxygalactose transaminase